MATTTQDALTSTSSSLTSSDLNAAAITSSIASPASTFSTSVKSSVSLTQASNAQPSGWTGGYALDPNSSGVDTNAGASGSDNGQGFNLSQGGMIAIIVVVAVVVILGIISTVLFVIAKRRQINIRQSIARMSRRMTGRAPRPSARQDNSSRRTDKRSGIGPYSNLQNSSSEKKMPKVTVRPAGK